MSKKTHPTLRTHISLLLFSLFFAYASILMNSFNSLAHAFMQRFNINPVQFSQLSAGYLLGTAAFLIPAGKLIDKYSSKPIACIALLIISIAPTSYGHSTNYTQLLVTSAIAGIFTSASFIGTVKYAWRHYPITNMGFITGSIITIGMLGAILAQTPLLTLYKSLGFTATMWLLSLTGLILFFLLLTICKEQPGKNIQSANSISIRTIMNLNNIKIAILTALLNLPIIVLGSVWGNTYLTNTQNMTSNQASLISSLLFIGMIFGSPLSGYVSDFIHSRKKTTLIGTLLSLFITTSILIFHISSIIILSILFLLLGIFASTQTASYTLIAETNTESTKATATSLAAVLVLISGVIGQPLFAYLAEQFNNLNTAFIIFPTAAALAILTNISIKKTT